MRYTGPRNRLSRTEGIDLGLKTPGSKSHSNLLKRLSIYPGQHGRTRRRRNTVYGFQLREKQKLKRLFGISESKMKLYFKKAVKSKGNTAELFIQLLQRRLDNVLYKLGFAPTRASARQLIVHGHIAVNNKKITIPSFLVEKGDTITFYKKKATEIPYISSLLRRKDFICPEWLKRQEEKGIVISLPSLENFKEDVNLQSVVEFYAR